MGGMAPLTAAVRRKPAHWMFGVPAKSVPASLPDGGTGDLIGLTVEIFINSAWTDITGFVRRGGGSGGSIVITRGRADETAQVQPQTAKLTLDNRDGRFSARNPTGPYYGQLTRNTPLRVSRLNNGVRRYRFYGEVPAWPTASDISGKDATTGITASGMLRRLRQGNQPLRSPMFRSWTTAYVSNGAQSTPTPLPPVAYWPCEDVAGSTQLASGLAGGSSMAIAGATLPTFATNSDFPGSSPLPVLAGSAWIGQLPPVSGATANQMRFLLSTPETGENDGAVLARMTTTGTVAQMELVYNVASSGTLTVNGYSVSGASLFTFPFATGMNGVPVTISMYLAPNSTPGFLNWTVGYTGANTRRIPSSGASSFVSGSLGTGTRITINPAGQAGSVAVGHVAYQTTLDELDFVAVWATAQIGEDPAIRFLRLCGEQSVPAFVQQTPSDADLPETFMGYQTTDTFAALLQQIPDLTFTPMWEARDQLSLVLRTRLTMLNQAAKLTLDMAQHHLSGPLVPVDDDQLTRNDVTASRQGGSSYEVAQASGSMSTQPPPAGIGVYPYDYSLSLARDSLLPDEAGWRLHFGTVDEPRYPLIPVNVRRFAGNVDLTNAVLTIDIGDRLDIINPPGPQFPPDPISQIVQGYTETLSNYEHDIVFNCSPASPWNVGYTDDPVYGHADTDGSTLASDYPLGTETALKVATTGAATGSPLWTTSAGDFPFDVNIGGERMTVTNITGAASPQTLTVTRSVNAVTKGQTSGTDVRLWQPMYLSL
jgi:hypothetical protein